MKCQSRQQTNYLLKITESGADWAKRIPSLTSYKSVASAGMIDITNNNSVPWLQKQLQDITKDYQIDAFYLDAGKNHVHKNGRRNLFGSE